MVVSWFSAGCSSFIAAYLLKDELDRIVYIDVADQHPDSLRFLLDCEPLLGKEIEVIRSDKFESVDDVTRRKRYINGPGGAPCTLELKKRVREKWERENVKEPTTYVWGYDCSERNRADRLKANMAEFGHRFPLIENLLTKSEVHGMCQGLGVKRPAMYDMGYPNNNCVGCVKGGMGYWNKIRDDFPKVFQRMAKRERDRTQLHQGRIFRRIGAREGRQQASSGRLLDSLQPAIWLICKNYLTRQEACPGELSGVIICLTCWALPDHRKGQR